MEGDSGVSRESLHCRDREREHDDLLGMEGDISSMRKSVCLYVNSPGLVGR